MNFDWKFGFGSKPSPELENIWPIPITENLFVEIDVRATYKRILTDVIERTDGIPDDKQQLVWDSCLGSEQPDGLITMLARSMANKSELFIVYFATLNVIRRASDTETELIRKGYKEKAEPVKLPEGGLGVFVTFKNYERTDMVNLYSKLEYSAVGGLWKQGKLSTAIQLKFKELRSSTGLGDSAEPAAQAVAIAKALAAGKDVAMDGEDSVESATPDLTSTKERLILLANKRSEYLGLPASYFSGILTGGLGDSGSGDAKAVDRGLRPYFFSIIKPVVDGIFTIKSTFKENDGDNISTALEVLKTMDVTSDEYMNPENKTKVVNKAFGLDPNAKGVKPKPVPAPVVPPTPAPNPPPAAG